MGGRLTIKQQRFAAFLVGPANGNQTLAARMAGYRGDDRTLAVQGSANMRNPQIQQMMTAMLDKMVKPSLRRLEEALDATKRRPFVTKAGDIVYTEPEPDHRARTATAKQVLELYQRTSGYTAGSEADVVPAHEDGAEPQKEMAEDPKTEGGADDGIVAQLDPADRALFEQAIEIEAELAKVDRELNNDGGHGTEH
jgi:hypothetical protein